MVELNSAPLVKNIKNWSLILEPVPGMKSTVTLEIVKSPISGTSISLLTATLPALVLAFIRTKNKKHDRNRGIMDLKLNSWPMKAEVKISEGGCDSMSA